MTDFAYIATVDAPYWKYTHPGAQPDVDHPDGTVPKGDSVTFSHALSPGADFASGQYGHMHVVIRPADFEPAQAIRSKSTG